MSYTVKDSTGSTKTVKSADDGTIIVPSRSIDFSQLQITRTSLLASLYTTPIAITGVPAAGKRVQLWGWSYLMLDLGVASYVVDSDVVIANFLQGTDLGEVLTNNLWRAVDPTAFSEPGNRQVARAVPLVNPTAAEAIYLDMAVLDNTGAPVTGTRLFNLYVQAYWMEL